MTLVRNDVVAYTPGLKTKWGTFLRAKYNYVWAELLGRSTALCNYFKLNRKEKLSK